MSRPIPISLGRDQIIIALQTSKSDKLIVGGFGEGGMLMEGGMMAQQQDWGWGGNTEAPNWNWAAAPPPPPPEPDKVNASYSLYSS